MSSLVISGRSSTEQVESSRQRMPKSRIAAQTTRLSSSPFNRSLAGVPSAFEAVFRNQHCMRASILEMSTSLRELFANRKNSLEKVLKESETLQSQVIQLRGQAMHANSAYVTKEAELLKTLLDLEHEQGQWQKMLAAEQQRNVNLHTSIQNRTNELSAAQQQSANLQANINYHSNRLKNPIYYDLP